MDRNQSGFTLVELLVVLCIFGILMGMVVGGASIVVRKTLETRAKMDARVVASVWGKYFAEYNHWPKQLFLAADTAYESNSDWVKLMAPDPRAATPHSDNLKRIVFLEPGSGAIHEKTGGFVDPWGTPFYFLLDSDLDGEIKPPSTENSDPDPVRAQVLVWSAGPDKNKDSWGDNIVSWK